MIFMILPVLYLLYAAVSKHSVVSKYDIGG